MELVQSGRGRSLEDDDSTLVLSFDVKVSHGDSALFSDRRDCRHRGQGIAGPDLRGESSAELRQSPIAHVIGEHLARHSHRQHSVGEDARVARDLRGEHLVGVQWVVVARRAGVLDDLSASQIVDDHRAVAEANADVRGA